MPEPRVPTPCCPRCGYDQSGLIATWSDSCPLRGVCSECGLEFAWKYVLDYDEQRPGWMFEHARRRLPSTLTRHLLLSFRPKRFWQAIQLHHSIVPARLALLAVVSLALGWVLISLTVMTCALWAGSPHTRPMFPAWRVAIQALTQPWEHIPVTFQRVTLTYSAIPTFEMSFYMVIAIWGVMCVCPLLLIQSIARARVRRWHLVRISVYELFPMSVIASSYCVAATVLMYLELVYDRADEPLWWRALLTSGWIGFSLVPLVWRWAAVYRHYLKVRRVWLIGVLFWIIGLLTVMILTYAIRGY